ncbi:MAG: hypothetical protein ACTSVO_05210 [Candidatus Heimdallarchaeaceae archaeon]
MISQIYLGLDAYNFWILQKTILYKSQSILINMSTKDTFLSFKLEKAIARIKTHHGYNNSPVFLEVCNCPSKGGSLYYDTRKAEYFGKGSCNRGLLCSKIQIDKHQIRISKNLVSQLNILRENEKMLEKEQLAIHPKGLIS